MNSSPTESRPIDSTMPSINSTDCDSGKHTSSNSPASALIMGHSSSFTSEPIRWSYVTWMTLFAVSSFLLILFIPFGYDQLNHRTFDKARADGQLLIREALPQFIELALEHASPDNEDARLAFYTDIIGDKRLISLDYMHQMKHVHDLRPYELFTFAGVLAILVAGGCIVVLKLVKVHLIRTTALAAIMLFVLSALQFFGLPHTNYKFHMIFGSVFAVLIAVGDYMFTLDLRLGDHRVDADHDQWPGYLSSLQYKHRFLTLVFNMTAVTALTVLCTMSFLAYNVFLAVFGESFAEKPFIGLIVTSSFALLGICFGLLRPMRRHIASIEDAMASFS